MSHEITYTNGRAEMAFVGETPWHGLGQRLVEGAPIEEWRKAAGMDWTIERTPVQYAIGQVTLEMSERHVLYRADTKAPLSVMGSEYEIVQPAQVLEFFRDLVESQNFALHTAGTLFGGRQYWALASIKQSVNLLGKDRVDGFLLLNSSADGSRATTARLTSVRVVCNNTLSAASREGKENAISLRHSTTFVDTDVKQRLGLVREHFEAEAANMERLVSKKLKVPQVRSIVVDLLALEDKTAAEQDKNYNFSSILSLYNGAGKGADLVTAKGTAWGLLNAVTEHVDFHARTKGANKVDNALKSAWFGRGDALKTQAYETLLKIAA